jgi:cytoskeletal protein CcmA (bactofilin family)
MNTTTNTTIRGNRRRAAFSLMLVMAVVAVASVLGMAILTSNTLQSEASRGQDQALQADALAESGINVGLYYLQNINDVTKCPLGISTISLALATAYTESNVSLGSQVAGTYTLKVERKGLARFLLTSTGNATGSQGTVSRTIAATVDLNYFGFAVNFNNSGASTTINSSTMTVNGDVYSAGPVVNSGTVTGTIYSNSVSGGGSQLAIKALTAIPALTPLPVVTLLPTVLGVNHYATYTWKDGSTKTSSATLLSTTLAGITKNSSAINPAGVFTYASDLYLNGGVVVNGTIVVRGKLYVTGSNTINPKANFPAIIVDSDISFADGATLTSNGLTFVGGQVTRTAGATAGATFNVTGTLLSSGGPGAIDATVTTTATYDRAGADVPSLGLLNGVLSVLKPSSVTIVSWKNNGTP